MQLGLKARILAGFLAIVVVFAGAMLFAVSRMHGISGDLRLIRGGYLSMIRLSTQVRTLQEAKDDYVRRALDAEDPGLRRHLAGYARTFYPRVMRDRLGDIDEVASSMAGRNDPREEAFLREVRELVQRCLALNDAFDEVTAELLRDQVAPHPADPQVLDAPRVDAPAPGDPGEEAGLQAFGPRDEAEVRKALMAAYEKAGTALSREVQTLGLRTEAKLGEAVLRAERDERDAALAVVVLSLFALGVGVLVAWGIGRGLLPLGQVLASARAISRGSLDVEVPAGGPEEVAALGREFNTMARALRERESSFSAQNEDLARLKLFSDDVIRSVQVGIVVLDEQGRVKTFNPAARSVFNLPLVDVEGRPLSELGGLDRPLEGVLGAVGQVRRTKEIAAFDGVRVAEKVVDIGLVPIRDRAGAPSSDVLLLGEDVTAREEAREQLVESERLAAIGRLAAQITHEIRNPLSSIGLNIDLLGDDVPHLPEQRQDEAKSILDAVGREVDRLSQITEGYLRYARLPTARHEVGDVGDLLADLCAFSQGEAAKVGVMLELQVEEAIPEVPHDPQRLRQALLNLLRNGLEAAGKGGTVRLAARTTGGGVQLSVEDSGPGLDDEAMAHLFEPFFTTKPQGTGLGLTLAQQIVREHGGELRAERSSLGGAAFIIELEAEGVVADDVAA